MPGRFVVFEGIDGSGKTTISNGVARLLRERGLTVEHVRENGAFASRVTQAIRELGRDSRNLALTPHAELLLYSARDAQLLEEATRPALARADVVIADRFLYSAEVLARHGRGLPAADVAPIIAAAARGLVPDLVILVDIDPHVARARRRLAKILEPDPRPPSRKGLAGAALSHRLRQGYLDLASSDPTRWLIIDNTSTPLSTLIQQIGDRIHPQEAKTSGPLATERSKSARSVFIGFGSFDRQPSGTRGLLGVDPVPRFLEWVDGRGEGEPGLAAYFLMGLYGEGVDERRERLAERVPVVVATGLWGLADPASVGLRGRLIERAPGAVARSIVGAATRTAEAAGWLEGLAEVVPGDVALALLGRDDDEAWSLRARLVPRALDAVARSLLGLGGDRAWELRERWLAAAGGESALDEIEAARIACASVKGVDDERAWKWRKAARAAAPVAALDSLLGLTSERAWKWRFRHVARAPKVVLRSVAGLDDPRAWALREETAGRVKEALDSMVGLDGERAWRLRQEHADLWPSTVAKSLGRLASSPRGAELVRRLLERHGDNVSLLKHATAIALGVDLGEDLEP